jgi:hypothetical protein
MAALADALPCPFCGSSSIDLDYAPDGDIPQEESTDMWIHCEECFCSGPLATIGCRDEEDGIDLESEAVVLWNSARARCQ